jgi:hypothetical protein
VSASGGERIRKHDKNGSRYIEFTATFAVEPQNIRFSRAEFLAINGFTDWTIRHLQAFQNMPSAAMDDPDLGSSCNQRVRFIPSFRNVDE